MTKIILYVAMSLDGFIARDNGDVDFLSMSPDENYGYDDFNKSIDTIVMGYGTYEKSLSFPGNPFSADKTHYVMTRKDALPSDDRVLFINEGLYEFVDKLIQEPETQNIWLMGGGDILHSFLKEQIEINEMMIFVLPLILGSGIPLFKSGNPELKLKLVETKNYSDGIVKLHYRS